MNSPLFCIIDKDFQHIIAEDYFYFIGNTLKLITLYKADNKIFEVILTVKKEQNVFEHWKKQCEIATIVNAEQFLTLSDPKARQFFKDYLNEKSTLL